MKASEFRSMIREIILSEFQSTPENPADNSSGNQPPVLSTTPAPVVDPKLQKAQEAMALLDKKIQELNSKKAPIDKQIAKINQDKERVQKHIDSLNPQKQQ